MTFVDEFQRSLFRDPFAQFCILELNHRPVNMNVFLTLLTCFCWAKSASAVEAGSVDQQSAALKKLVLSKESKSRIVEQIKESRGK